MDVKDMCDANMDDTKSVAAHIEEPHSTPTVTAMEAATNAADPATPESTLQSNEFLEPSVLKRACRDYRERIWTNPIGIITPYLKHSRQQMMQLYRGN
mmetsp:Transcript_60601/g.70903  ORF Transcript_60601/g.70903 Transcript_60601/m.70903 type:complete len:98 (-) Transcript_60601:98-391(-)